MIVFAEASSEYEVDCVSNQVDEDLKYLERDQYEFLKSKMKIQPQRTWQTKSQGKGKERPPESSRGSLRFEDLGRMSSSH